MKWWTKELEKMRVKNQTYQSVYEMIISHPNNIFSEQKIKNQVIKTTYHDCEIKVEKYSNIISKLLRDTKLNSFVAIKSENNVEWMPLFFAVLKAGFKPLLLNIRTSENSIAEVIKITKPVLIITDKENDHTCLGLVESKYLNYVSINEIINEETTYQNQNPWADEIALCSSGTTNIPKIVIYDGQAICKQIYNSEYVFENNPHSSQTYKGVRKHLAFLPFYHVFGLFAVLLWYSFYGDTFVFLTDIKPDSILEACRYHKVTHVYAVPVFWNTVANYIKMIDAKTIDKKIEKSIKIQTNNPRFGQQLVSSTIFKNLRKETFGDSFRFGVNGAGSIYLNTIKTINALGYPLYNGFGMTEVGITSVEISHRIEDRIKCAIGQPFKNTEYLVKPFNEEDPSIGELMIRSQGIHFAMFENDQLVHWNKNDYFASGDIVRKSEGERYYIHGKLKDIIINESGENIFPNDIELYFNLPGVLNQCVVGINNEKGYEDIYLVLELMPNLAQYKIRKMMLKINEINNKLPSNYQIKRILICEGKLPMVMGTKVRRQAVKELIENNKFKYLEYNLSDFTSHEKVTSENLKEIIKQLKEIFGDILGIDASTIKDNDHFIFDLGGNSLNYYTLVSAVEQTFQIKYNLDGESICSTPYDFAKYIEKK